MVNSSGKLVRGLFLGSTLVGLGIYLSKNRQLTNQLTEKLKEFNIPSTEKEVQDKLIKVVHSTKDNLYESLDKTRVHIDQTVSRLITAFNAGKKAAVESLNDSKTEVHHLKKTVLPKETNLKEPVQSHLGATEDTSPENTSPTLHSSSKNIAKSVGDAGTSFENNIKEMGQ